MGGKTKKVATAAAVVVMLACVAAGQQHPQPEAEPGEIIKSLANANNTDEAKERIKALFDSTVAEITSAIKRTAVYKRTESDKLMRGALDVCEHALNSSIFSVRRSFDNIDNFEVSSSSHYVLFDVRIYLSAAINFKSSCIDGFAKTRGDTRKKVTEILRSSGRLLSSSLAMVIEFEKLCKSLNLELGLGGITDQIKKQSQRLLGETSLPPKVTVALDGSGDFDSIQKAVDQVPLGNTDPFVIFVKAGIYKEYVFIPNTADHVVLVGEGPWNTTITGTKSYGGPDKSGVMVSGTLIVEGDSFTAKDIAIENTAGPLVHQAVAVRSSGDLGIFYNVHIDAYQDTLFTHAQRQLFRQCRISGTVDFIFGNSVAVFQKCEILVRKPMAGQRCFVTAQGRNEKDLNGITLLQGCRITAEKEYQEARPPFESYLGRPWKELSTTVIMQSIIEEFIAPEGWFPWKGKPGYQDTLYYVEYDNTGSGSETEPPPKARVQWKGIHHFGSVDEARSYTAKTVYQKDEWAHEAVSGVPYDEGLMDKDDIANFFRNDPFAPQPTTFSPQKTHTKPSGHESSEL